MPVFSVSVYIVPVFSVCVHSPVFSVCVYIVPVFSVSVCT